MNARWHIKKIFGGIRQNYERSTVNASDELNASLTFDRFRYFFYCQEKVLIKEKIKKIKRKIRKFKNT